MNIQKEVEKARKIIGYFILIYLLFHEMLIAQTGINTTFSMQQINTNNLQKVILTSNEVKNITQPFELAFTGNLLGSLMGGLVGAGLTTASGLASGGIEDVDKTLLGLYIGGIIGSGLGSSLALNSKDTKGFRKILIRSFIPHVICTGGALLLSEFTETPEDVVILGGLYLVGWILSPVEAARAYKSTNANQTSLGLKARKSRYNELHVWDSKRSFSFKIEICTRTF